MEYDLTLGGGHKMKCTDHVSQNVYLKPLWPCEPMDLIKKLRKIKTNSETSVWS